MFHTDRRILVDAELADQAGRFSNRRHASLNFGDCLSYPLSALMQEPLLFKR